MSDQNQFCLDMLREHDRPMFTSLLFLSEEQRLSASILQAFHLEIGRIAFLVKEPMPGEIRLQWWRDVFNGLRSDEANANPLASSLMALVSQYELSLDGFTRYLDARVFDLYNDPMPDRETLEAYFGETESFIFHMMALTGGNKDSSDLANACGHTGVVIGIERMLTRITYDRNRQRCFIPKDDLEKAGLSVDQWYGEVSDACNSVVSAQLDYANVHLEKAKTAINQLPKKSHGIFLSLVLSAARIKHMQASGPQTLLKTENTGLSEFRLQWALWKTAVFGF